MGDQYIENVTAKIIVAIKPHLRPIPTSAERQKRDKELHDKIYKVVEGSII